MPEIGKRIRNFGDKFGFLIVPVLIIVLAVALVISSFMTSFSDVLAGRGVLYSQEQLYEYANEQYSEQFAALKDTEGFKECLLLVVFVDGEGKEWYPQSLAGEKVPAGVSEPAGQKLLGNLNAASNPENPYYKESFSEKLAWVVNVFANSAVVDAPLSNAQGKVQSALVNNTTVEIAEADEKAINDKLQALTDRTGVPVVVVVADGVEQFSSSILTRNIITVVFAVLLVAVSVFLIVKHMKEVTGEQAEAPAEEQAEAPAEEQAEAPAEEQAEAPAEEQAEAPAEEQADAPAEEAEAPADEAEAPADEQ